jgi:hypothetical protein
MPKSCLRPHPIRHLPRRPRRRPRSQLAHAPWYHTSFASLIFFHLLLDIYFGGLAARAIITAINIRLTAPEVSYILEHSGVKLVLVDHQFTHLIPKDIKARVVVCGDTGRDGEGDEYEAFLSAGRRYSGEKGWMGLEVEGNEDASAILCYTCVSCFGLRRFSVS